MKTVPKHARCRRTPAEQAAYRQKLTRVSPVKARAKIGVVDYRLFTQFQAMVAKIRAEEYKHPTQRNEAKLTQYRRRAVAFADQLYQRHCRLVYKAVNQYLRHLDSIRTTGRENAAQVNATLSQADLVQEGCIGLLIAFEDFVPRAGYRFSTYAQQWIYQAITRPVMMSVEVPSYINPILKRLKQAREKLGKILNCQPTNEELFQATGLNRQKFRLALQAERRAAGRTSLDALTGYEAILLASDQPDPTIEFDRQELANVLTRAFQVAGLTKRQREVLKVRFGLNGQLPLKLEDIGKQYGVTRERIRQIEKKAIKKLASKAQKILEPYLYLIT